MSREKERSSEHLSTVEEYYKRQLDLLQGQLKAVEKERNLMMATLRQEGLVGKLRSERLEPFTCGWNKNEEPVKDITEPESNTVLIFPQTETKQDDEPLTTVLEDLKSLTDAVLKDDHSETDSENES